MAEQTLPSPAALLVKPDGRPDDTWYQRLTLMWRAYNQTRQDVTDAATSLTGDIDDGIDARIATQAELEAASALTTLVPPGLVNFNPGVAKCWGLFNFAAGISASHNITSLTDGGAGIIDVTIATDFSSATWSALATPYGNASFAVTIRTDAAQSAGTARIGSWASATGAAQDSTLMNFAGFGDQ